MSTPDAPTQDSEGSLSFRATPEGVRSPRHGPLRPFLLLAALSTGMALVFHHMILTEEVLRGLLPDSQEVEAQTAESIRVIRSWGMLGALLTPVTLIVRLSLHAMLVQLALFVQGRALPFGEVFRGAVWAGFATWLGTVMQAFWVVTLPFGALHPDTLRLIPGSLGTLLPGIDAAPLPTALLLQQISVFDLAWIVLFAIALETHGRPGPLRALATVCVVWTASVLSRWTILLYLSGL